MTRYDSVGMTRWLDILLRLTGKRHRGKALNIIIWQPPFMFADVAQWTRWSMCMRELRGSTPSRGILLAVLFGSFFFLTSFFYLLAGFILLVLPHYSFASCCVKRIFIFGYNAFEWREYLGDGFYCSGNQSVVCMPNALALHCLTHWMGLALKFKNNVRKNKVS